MNKTQKNRQKRGIDLVSNLIKRNRPLLITLSAAVVFVTTYLLILPAVTLDNQQAQKQGGIDLPAAQEQQAEPAAADDAAVDDADAADAAETEEPAEPATVKKSATGEEPEEGDDLPAQSAAREQHGDFYALSYDGGDYNVALAYPESAEIPADAGLEVREIPQGSGEYNQYLKKSAKKLGVAKDDVAFARFFDIQITRDGEKIEPSDDVVINVTYEDPLQTEEADDLSVVHFGEDGTEVIDAVSVDESRQEIAWQQDSFSVTGTILTQAPASGDKTMVLVQYEDNYYIVNNDGTLTRVEAVTDGGKTTVSVDNPMLWTFNGSNLYHPSIQVDFTSGQIASDYYYRYIDPASDASDGELSAHPGKGLTQDTAENTALKDNSEWTWNASTWSFQEYKYKTINGGDSGRQMMQATKLTYEDGRLKSQTGNKYIGVINDGGTLRITGGVTDPSKAATILFADAEGVLPTDYLNHTVNHIDISIVGAAGIDVPLAYGKYYNANHEEILNVTSNKTLHLTKDSVSITTADMKKASIAAYTKNEDGSIKDYIDDAYVITGYSANASTEFSTDQVRIEGDFKVADLDPVSLSQYNANPQAVWAQRLANRIYYSVTAIKPITFDLVDPDLGQLYDANGEKLTITVDVAFSASFNYFDKGNECPPVQWEQARVLQGLICTHNMSGMDFVLGGNPDASQDILAIEITKLVVDENGNRIKSKDPVTNTFAIYKGNNSTSYDDVKELGREDLSKYTIENSSKLHDKTISVGDDGLGLVYDYDVDAGMYFIQEDQSTIPDTIRDQSGNEWNYKNTRIETEYAWRNCEYDGRMHQSETYTKGSGSYTSIPEVLGSYKGYSDRKDYRNGFLEFFVYNVYEPETVDVPVNKTWRLSDKEQEEQIKNWSAKFQLQWAPLDEEGNLSGNFQDVPGKTITINNNTTEADSVFKGLPKYTTDASGNTIRIQYSLEELSYSLTIGEDVYTWSKKDGYKKNGDPAGQNDQFQPFYPHDAGELIEGGAAASEKDDNYHIDVTNARKNVSGQEYIDLDLTKQWDDALQTDKDSYAKFTLKRYVHTEYRDLSFLSQEDRGAHDITVTLQKEDGTVLDTVTVKPHTSLYLAGNFAPRASEKAIAFQYTNEGGTVKEVKVTASGANMSKELVRSTEFHDIKTNTTITITSGAEYLVTGKNGIDARILDSGHGTDPQPDETFAQEITLNEGNGWKWASEHEQLLQREVSSGVNDDNENVTIYEYYFVEGESSPDGLAQYYLADKSGKRTQIKEGDIDNRIDTSVSVIAENTPPDRLKVTKIWRGVPDTKGFPEISFTLYQGWLNSDGTVSINGGDSWVYENPHTGVKYENVELNEDNHWTWLCPEDLPVSRESNGRSRAVGYYVKESADKGTDGGTTWQFYYYANDKGKQTNAYNQGGGAGISGEVLKDEGGQIDICNQLGRYLQMDIKKQFFELKEAGSWDNTTASHYRNAVLGFKVIRAVKTEDGQWLDENGSVAEKPVWSDYGDELFAGYDNNGNTVVQNGGHNDFYLESGGGDWHFRIRDEQGGANDREIDKIGLPASGFYTRDGKTVPVKYAYSFREVDVYKYVGTDDSGKLILDDYPDWDWFSSVTPTRYVDADGQHEFTDKIIKGQDGERIANIQASDLTVTKNWNGDTDVKEVYVKIYRQADGETEPEDFTAIIAEDIKQNKGWQSYISDPEDVDLEKQWLRLSNQGSGKWTTSSIVVNRALLGTVDSASLDAKEYKYWIEEAGYMDAEGVVHATDADNAQKFRPAYSKWDSSNKTWQAVSAGQGGGITLGAKGENGLRVTNTAGPMTSYTVTKKFKDDENNPTYGTYPTDGSQQVVVTLQQRYKRINETTKQPEGEYSEWETAQTANPQTVTLPLSKPETKPETVTIYTEDNWESVTDAQWYNLPEAWTYTWTGLDVTKKLTNEAGDPVRAQLYYRAVEVGTPAWFTVKAEDGNEISSTNPEGHIAVNDEDQTDPQKAEESNVVLNDESEYSLDVSKKWTKDGEAMASWPADYTVDYQLVRNYHLVNLNDSGETPSYSLGKAFKTEEVSGSNGTLNAGNPKATVDQLPTYGFLTPKDSDVAEAAKTGVSLTAGQRYLVAYSYSVKETAVQYKGNAIDFAPQTADSKLKNENTSATAFAAELTNDLTEVTVKKQWQKDGETIQTWPADAAVNYQLQRIATYKPARGNAVTFPAETVLDREHTSYGEAAYEALTAGNAQTGVSLGNLPTGGTVTLDADNTYGLEAGTYAVTYRYFVVEDPEGSTAPTGSGLTYSAVTAQPDDNQVATLVNDTTDLTVQKNWTKNGSAYQGKNGEKWPAGYKVNWKVVQKASDGTTVDPYYLAKDTANPPAHEDKRLTEANAVDGVTLSYLPKTGVNAQGQTVTYTYEVYEVAEGSEKPSDSNYSFQDSKAQADGTGKIFTMTNDLAGISVQKIWQDQNGNTYNPQDDEYIKLKLYSSKTAPGKEEKIRVSVKVGDWLENTQPPQIGSIENIVVKGDDGSTYTYAIAGPDWIASMNLPKYNDQGEEITYHIESVGTATGVEDAAIYNGSDHKTVSGENGELWLQAKGEDRPVTTGSITLRNVDYNGVLEIVKLHRVDNDEEMNKELWGDTITKGNSWTWTGLTPGVQYYVQVKGFTNSQDPKWETDGDNVIYEGWGNENRFTVTVTEGDTLITLSSSTPGGVSIPLQVEGRELLNNGASIWLNTYNYQYDASATTWEWGKKISDITNSYVSIDQYNEPKSAITGTTTGVISGYGLQVGTNNWPSDLVYTVTGTGVVDFGLDSNSGQRFYAFPKDCSDLKVTISRVRRSNSSSATRSAAKAARAMSIMDQKSSVSLTSPAPTSTETVTAGTYNGPTQELNQVTPVGRAGLPRDAQPYPDSNAQPVTLNNGTGWSYSWDDLPAEDENGEPIYYYVLEDEVNIHGKTDMVSYERLEKGEEGNTTDSVLIKITNKVTQEQPKLGNLKVTKKMSGLTTENHWTKEFKFTVRKKGGQYIGGNGEWSDSPYEWTITSAKAFLFKNIPEGNYIIQEITDGDPIPTIIEKYTFNETDSITGTGDAGVEVLETDTETNPQIFDLDNRYEPETTEVTVNKAWSNLNGSTTPPAGAKVQFELHRSVGGTEDGTFIDTITLDGVIDETGEDHPWEASWEDLRKCNDDEAEYTYYVTEAKCYYGENDSQTLAQYRDSYPSGNNPAQSAINGQTITNTEQPTSIEVTKKWKSGASDKDRVFTEAKTIEFTLHQVYTKGEETVDNVYTAFGGDGKGTVTYDPQKNKWSTESIGNLPKKVYDDGRWYDASYYVVEDEVPQVETTYQSADDAKADAADAATDSGTITITNTDTTVTLTVEKTWADLESNVPYEITFKVQESADGGETWTDYDGDDEGTDADSFTMRWDGSEFAGSTVTLPAGKQYRAVETGYKVTVNGSTTIEKTGLSIEGTSKADGVNWKSALKNRLDTIKISGTKFWADEEAEHDNPTLTLTRTSVKPESSPETLKAKPGTLTDLDPQPENNAKNLQPVWTYENNELEYTYQNLPKYDSEGYEYVYSVAEDSMVGYVTKETASGDASGFGKDFTNTQTGALTVKKHWFPGARETDKISIEYKLQKKVGSAGSWEDVPPSQVGLTKYALPVTKTEGEGGEQTTTRSWSQTIGDLPVYQWVTDSQTQVQTLEKITYRVLETKVNGTEIDYTAEQLAKEKLPKIDVQQTADGGTIDWIVINPDPSELSSDHDTEMTINNDQDQIALSGKKTWVTERTGTELPEWTVKLYKVGDNDEELTEIPIQSEDSEANYYFQKIKNTGTSPQVWNYSITHLPRTEGGQKVKYRVKEVMTGEPASLFTASDEWAEGTKDRNTGYITGADFTNTEVTSISAEKTWELNGEATTAPTKNNDSEITEVTLHLYQVGTETKEIKDSNGEAFVMHRTGEEGNYTWTLNVTDLPKYYVNPYGGKLEEYLYFFQEDEAMEEDWWHASYSIDGGRTSVAMPAAARVNDGTITIHNAKWTRELPSTGGPGTTWIYLLGTILLLGCGVALTSRRRARTRHQ